MEAHIPEIKAVQRLVCRRAHGHTVALFGVFSFKEKKRKMQKRGRQESERERLRTILNVYQKEEELIKYGKPYKII